MKQKPLNCDIYIREDDRQAIENVLKALEGKDCVIETQAHNEEVNEEIIEKLETYKKIAENLAKKLEDIILTCYRGDNITIEKEVVKEYLDNNKSIKDELIDECRNEVNKNEKTNI